MNKADVILQFANLDSLKLALTSNVIPEAVRAMPIQFALARGGSVTILTTGALADKTRHHAVRVFFRK